MCITVLTPILHNIIVTAIFGLGLFLRAKCEEDLLVRAEGYGIFRNRVKNLFFSAPLSAPAGARSRSRLVRAAVTNLIVETSSVLEQFGSVEKVGTGVFLWLAIMLAGLAVERLHPAEKGQPRSNIILNLVYSIVHFWAIFAEKPIAAAAAAIAVGVLGGGVIVLPGAGWGLFWAIPLYLLAMDLAEYLFHRAQHAWPFLWAMHSLHHSDTALNITTTTRHFWIEMAFKLLFVYPFVNLLLRPSPVVLIAYVIANYWNFVAHMNIRLSFGRFWPMLNSPQYPRGNAPDLVTQSAISPPCSRSLT